MSSIYTNFRTGTLTSGINSTQTTITSAGFANLPNVVTPDTMFIVIDPQQTGGTPEIVLVTAHSTTVNPDQVTVTRGQQTAAGGSVGRAHNAGTTWTHSWTKGDTDLLPHRILTTKGDILVGTGSNDLDRLPVGINNYALVADSAQTLGVKWAPAASSVSSLTDVTLTSLTSGNFLRYDGTKWVNTSIVVFAGGGDANARAIYIDNIAPTGGVDGDIWLRYA